MNFVNCRTEGSQWEAWHGVFITSLSIFGGLNVPLYLSVKLGGICIKISVKVVPSYLLRLQIESPYGNILKWSSFSRRSDQKSECTVFLHRTTFLIVRTVSCVLFCFCDELFNQVTDFHEIGLNVIPLNSPSLSWFLLAFAKLRKATIRFIMFVRPSFSPHGSTRKNLSRKFMFH